METLILTIHLILALLLIGVVLLQRSEGGALLSGGGNTQARAPATPLTKVTWILAVAFICTSITLTILATRGSDTGSVVDGAAAPAAEEAPAADPALPPSGEALLPPGPGGDAPATPPRADEPATPPAAEAPAEGAAPAAPAEGTPAPTP